MSKTVISNNATRSGFLPRRVAIKASAAIVLTGFAATPAPAGDDAELHSAATRFWLAHSAMQRVYDLPRASTDTLDAATHAQHDALEAVMDMEPKTDAGLRAMALAYRADLCTVTGDDRAMRLIEAVLLRT